MSDPLARLMLVPAVKQALADAESAVGSIQLSARRRGEQFAAQAWGAAATSSSAMDASDPVVAASLLVEVRALTNVRASLLQALARMHAIAAADLPDDQRGRPRADFAEGERLSALATLTATSTAPALLVATIAHAELLVLAPFEQANGLLARAVWRAIIVESGLDPTGMVMVETGLRDLGIAAYAAALEEYRSGTSAGVGAWVRHCARSVELGVEALRQLLN